GEGRTSTDRLFPERRVSRREPLEGRRYRAALAVRVPRLEAPGRRGWGAEEVEDGEPRLDLALEAAAGRAARTRASRRSSRTWRCRRSRRPSPSTAPYYGTARLIMRCVVTEARGRGYGATQARTPSKFSLLC